MKAGEEHDESGIVVCGEGEGPDGELHAYVIDDRSLRGTPNQVMNAVAAAFHKWQADCVVIETNQGGDWIRNTLRTVGRQAAQGLETWRSLDATAEILVEDDRSDRKTLETVLPGVAARCDILLGPYSTQLMRAAGRIAAESGWLCVEPGRFRR